MTEPDPGACETDPAARRRERRAWIAAHHPDTGGDPAEFARGLAEFDGPPRAPAPRPVVVRSRNPLRAGRRWLRRVVGRRPARTLH